MQDKAAELKKRAAEKAVSLVESGMILGLGHGSTAKFAVDLIGEKVKSGELRDIVGVPTSKFTAQQASGWGVKLGELVNYPALDLAIDGADEVDPQFNATKGWGGALVREKMVEMHARRLVIIVDESKIVNQLATRGPIPVEVIPFSWDAQARWLADSLGCTVERRTDNGETFITDNGNYVLHCSFADGLPDPYAFHNTLAGRTGVVGHGLFLDLVTDVIVASPVEIKHLRK